MSFTDVLSELIAEIFGAFFLFRTEALLVFLLLDNTCREYPLPKDLEKMSLLPKESECGLRASISERIVGGQNDTICSFPWNVQIISQKSNGSGFCTGSIINKNYVLTAAHCCIAEPSGMVVVVGQSAIVRNPKSELKPEKCPVPCEIIQVEDYTIHPRYFKKFWFSDDIALIRLSKTLKFNGVFMPVCLPLKGDDLSESDTDVIASGWGILSDDLSEPLEEVRPKTLQKISCRVVNGIFCRLIPAVYHRTLERCYLCLNCTKSTSKIRAGTSFGDSGGPAIKKIRKRWYQVGITSYGVNVSIDSPDMLVRVSRYTTWIQNTMYP